LDPIFNWAATLAADPGAIDALREPAIHLLGRRPDKAKQEEDLKTLAGLLNSSISPRLLTAALDTLKHNRSPQIPALLLSGWKVYSPALRQSAIEVLLARDEWTRELLSAVESGTVGRNEVSPASRQRLLKDPHLELQKRAQALWQGATSGNRAGVLAKYQSATTLPGDPARGANVFGSTCATCHFLRGQGHEVGPNLAALAGKSPSDFLTAILDPNAAVEPRFIAYNIETKDGRSLSGIVNAETATTLTVVQGGGIQERILRSDIEEIRASGLSLMPEGLEQNLGPQELADLIAFLKTTPRPFGSATAEEGADAKKAFLAGGMNGLARLISAFDQLPYPSWMGPLPLHYCRQTDGKSKLAWETQPVPADLKPEGVHQFRLPAAMGHNSQAAGKFELRLNAKAKMEFNVVLTDQSWQSADGKLRMTYTVLENNSEDSNGVLVIEVAASLLEPGKAANFEVIGSRTDSQRWFGIYVIPPLGAAGR
jgi:putative heme-binding domain-containing protein